MRLNKDAAAVLRLMGATHILILWDEAALKIAFSSTPASDSRGYKLSYHPKGSGAGFAAKAFLKHIGWKATNAIPLKLTLQKGMLQADLPAEHLSLDKMTKPRKRKITVL